MACSHSNPETFPKDECNRVRRSANRATYDRAAVFAVLDASLIGNFAISEDGRPVCIPMMYARDDDQVFVHGSTKSRLMNYLCSGRPICLSVTILDGLVLAKSLFNHSMNYRSVSVFGLGREIQGEQDKLRALKLMTDKMMPGRWEDARQPATQELKATAIAAIQIETASAKIRTGGPSDNTEDLSLPVWSGTIPMRTALDSPVPLPSDSDLPHPEYLRNWCSNPNQQQWATGGRLE